MPEWSVTEPTGLTPRTPATAPGAERPGAAATEGLPSGKAR
ncbi:hypothetical protein [Streptomyces roseolilacinus]